jgi:hypothetical protein
LTLRSELLTTLFQTCFSDVVFADKEGREQAMKIRRRSRVVALSGVHL